MQRRPLREENWNSRAEVSLPWNGFRRPREGIWAYVFSGNALLVFGLRGWTGKSGGCVHRQSLAGPRGRRSPAFRPDALQLHPFDAATRADCSDAVSVDQQRAIADETQFRQGSSASRDRTPQRDQLRAAGDQPIGHVSGPDTNAYICKTLPHIQCPAAQSRGAFTPDLRAKSIAWGIAGVHMTGDTDSRIVGEEHARCAWPSPGFHRRQ